MGDAKATPAGCDGIVDREYVECAEHERSHRSTALAFVTSPLCRARSIARRISPMLIADTAALPGTSVDTNVE
jgi:hypothetical protein